MSENDTLEAGLVCSVQSEVLQAVRHRCSHDQSVDYFDASRPVIECRHLLANPHHVAEHLHVLDDHWNADQGALRFLS